MQEELKRENSKTKIRILGIDAVGFESSISIMTKGRTLPLLQDTPTENVWDDWGATWRDVVMLNPDNIHVDTYNLTSHDLANPDNYRELKARLKRAAGEP